jgi:phosphoribosyl 1,2-cyclic phosphodiesterase
MQGDPRENRDYRNNPSLLIQFRDEEGVVRNVAIDVGKTFRETALRWMPFHNIRSLDAVVLTHHHMDAVAGLDDLRGFQKVQRRSLDPAVLPVRVPMSVFMSQECYDQVSSQFPWLFPQSVTFANTIKKRETVPRDVASLDVALIKDFEPFNAKGLTLVPLPVWHGDDLISLGFAFSVANTNVVYLSDISRMKPETLDFIQKKLPPTDIFICDTLLNQGKHPVHFCLDQAMDLARKIGAKQTYLVGMNCDSFPGHDEMNARLAKEAGISIAFAHDGQVIALSSNDLRNQLR